MTAPTNIFDTLVTNDLPSELAKQLIRKTPASKSEEMAARLIQLLTIAQRPLHATELCVGYYRKFGEIKKVSSIYTKLCLMSNTPDSGVQKDAPYTFSLVSSR